MDASKTIAVVTSIQAPTPSVRALVSRLAHARVPLLVVGDKKGPSSYDLPGAELLPLDHQLALGYRLGNLLPVGHYARKNLGYLEAIRRGADCIYETDDDNEPLDSFRLRQRVTQARRASPGQWSNVYAYFTDSPIWPRGFPLQHIRGGARNPNLAETVEVVDAPIQQGLANGSPDVDAVWRLVFGDEVAFRPSPSVILPPGTWCPFNSQTTWWWQPAFPLLYLPSHCSFRMTDIWRSFVAQRCLWEGDAGIVFHAAEVRQQRNDHVLLRDFQDEIPGYLENERLVSVLAALDLNTGESSLGPKLLTCYQALVSNGLFPDAELALVKAWLEDLDFLRQQT